jgi:cytochrome c biogenesis factor
MKGQTLNNQMSQINESVMQTLHFKINHIYQLVNFGCLFCALLIFLGYVCLNVSDLAIGAVFYADKIMNIGLFILFLTQLSYVLAKRRAG